MVSLRDAPLKTQTQYAFFYADISEHSRLVEIYKDQFKKTRTAFKRYISERVRKRNGCIHSWAGDGGTAVFWGEREAEHAVFAALESLTDMSLFNLEHNPLTERIDAKFGVHLGLTSAERKPDEWYGDGINKASKFFGTIKKSGVLQITQPVYNSLTVQLRGQFQKTRRFSRLNVFEFDRSSAYGPRKTGLRYLSAKTKVEVLNKGGDALITKRAEVQNTSPQEELRFIETNIGSAGSQMKWSDCRILAWQILRGKRKRELDIRSKMDDPHLKAWEIEFPPLKPDDPPLELEWSCRWNKMFPRRKEHWITHISNPCDFFETRVIFPKSAVLREEALKAFEIEGIATRRLLCSGYRAVPPEKSDTGRWEIFQRVDNPSEGQVYRLEWSLQRA